MSSKWLETAVLTALLPLIGALIRPHDPLLLSAGFAWVILPPLLVWARHGFAPALASAAVLAATQIVLQTAHWTAPVAGELTIGPLVVVGLVGYASNALHKRNEELQVANGWLWRRFNELSRAFLLLDISHSRIEQRMTGGVLSLRASLAALRHSIETHPHQTIEQVGPLVAEIFSSYARVQIGSLHRVHDNRLDPVPIAQIGHPLAVRDGDPLVRACLEWNKLAMAAEVSSADEPTGLMAAVPLANVAGKVVGVLAVQAMPFTAFEAENFKLIAVIAGHVGDLLGQRPLRASDERQQLELAIRRAVCDARDHGLAHALVLISCDDSQGTEQLIEHVLAHELREIDHALILPDRALERDELWAAAGDGELLRLQLRPRHRVLAVLLGLTSRPGVMAFQQRISTWSVDHLHADPEALGVSFHTQLIDGGSSGDTIVGLLFPTER